MFEEDEDFQIDAGKTMFVKNYLDKFKNRTLPPSD
jgi:hypothetical protein